MEQTKSKLEKIYLTTKNLNEYEVRRRKQLKEKINDVKEKTLLLVF